jgi:hypothetical protein
MAHTGMHRIQRESVETVVLKFMDNFERAIESIGNDPTRIWVADETAIGDGVAKLRVWGDPDLSRSHKPLSSFTTTITTMATANASGTSISPFYIIDAKGDFSNPTTREKFGSICNGMPGIAVTCNGEATSSMNCGSFESYCRMFAATCGATLERPHVLVIDGAGVHGNAEVLESIADLGVYIAFLPPWMSAVIQVTSTLLSGRIFIAIVLPVINDADVGTC